MDRQSLTRMGFGDVCGLLDNHSYFNIPESGDRFWTETKLNTKLTFSGAISGSQFATLNINEYSPDTNDLIRQKAIQPSETYIDYSKPFSKNTNNSFGFIDRNSLVRMGLGKIPMTADLVGIKYPETQEEHDALANTQITLRTFSQTGNSIPDDQKIAIIQNISGYRAVSIF
jgi:hypothetical protein